jgi:hypothetical protein
MKTIRQQIHSNLVALISLVVAVTALAYNTWRNETTEEQRNVRHAAFRVIESLGELQEVVDMRYYYLPYESSTDTEGRTRIHGFGNLAMSRDLMSLMPAPAPEAGRELQRQWLRLFGHLAEIDGEGKHTAAATHAEQALTGSIERAREAVLQVLHELE